MIEATSNLDQLIRLLAASILVHELLYVSDRGLDYISRCVAPVLGLQLNRVFHSAVHVLLIIVAAWLSLNPDRRLLLPMLLLLSATIASYSFRLSNHLVVAWFFFLTLTIDFLRHGAITSTSVLGLRTLVIFTYAFAAFHKLNRDYFTSKTSCSVRLVHFYFQEKLTNSWLKKQLATGIWVSVIVEAAIPVLLLFDRVRVVGVLVAISLHALFGLARNAHFSVVMYAGLIVFLPPTNLSLEIFLLASVLGVWMGFRYSMWKVYPIRKLALGLHIMFGVLTVYMVAWTLNTAGSSPGTIPMESLDWLAIALVLLLFALNASSPYYSSKTEFSLAMFSNLRPDRWSHFIIKQRIGRLINDEYVKVVKIQGMPELSNCRRASLTYKLVRAFKPYYGRKYLKYYLVESLKSLHDQLGPDFFVEIADSKQQIRISLSTDLSTLKHRRMCLMPIVIPSDPEAPYCN